MAVLSIKDFPDELIERLKIAAIQERTTLRNLVTERLAASLDSAPKPKKEAS